MAWSQEEAVKHLEEEKERNRGGFTMIPHIILEALMKFRCSGGQKDILLAVIRATYGFHHKDWQMGVNYLAKLTGRHKRKVASDVRELIDHKVLIQVSGYSSGSCRIMRLNENTDEWLSPRLAKQAGIVMGRKIPRDIWQRAIMALADKS